MNTYPCLHSATVVSMGKVVDNVWSDIRRRRSMIESRRGKITNKTDNDSAFSCGTVVVSVEQGRKRSLGQFCERGCKLESGGGGDVRVTTKKTTNDAVFLHGVVVVMSVGIRGGSGVGIRVAETEIEVGFWGGRGEGSERMKIRANDTA
jgi:hypothetical protein